MRDEKKIPLIDLSARPGSAEIADACRRIGCFNVSGGAIENAMTESLLEQMESFFRLPDDHPLKRAVHRQQNQGANGWTPMLEEPAYEPGTIAWVESFDCVLARERLARLEPEVRQGILPSIWPQLPDFREVVRAHWDALMATADQIFPLISELLQQDPGFLASRASSQALNTMRLLNYPQRPGLDAAINRGISAHTDFECITFIHQTAPGLQVRTPQGDWIEAGVEEGEWTVLIGDMIERWSNGVYAATPHRVPVTPWPRRSIVMFVAADPGLEVRPLEAFVDASNPPRFEPDTQDGLINAAMSRAEANRQAMLPEVERMRSEISRG
jgi:isopenicillin N synthase-like dioxygenase